MPTYCVDIQPRPDGTHEVHNVEFGRCDRLPAPASRIEVGYFTSAHGAVARARKEFRRVNGCPRCCPEAHASVVVDVPPRVKKAMSERAPQPTLGSPLERSRRPRERKAAGR